MIFVKSVAQISSIYFLLYYCMKYLGILREEMMKRFVFKKIEIIWKCMKYNLIIFLYKMKRRIDIERNLT